MRPVEYLLVAALMLPAPALAAADQPSAPAGEIRLSDAEKEKVLEAAAARNRQPMVSVADQLDDEPLPPQVHGEVGFSIGTGGFRSAYGVASVPLSGDGFATITLETTDFGSRPRYLGPWWR